jgi:hypothetical protein
VPFEDNGAPTSAKGVVTVLAALLPGGGPDNPQPGDLTTLRAPKVLIRRFSREPSAFADRTGEFIVQKGSGGAIAVRLPHATEDDFLGFEALFHSALYQWLARGFGSSKYDETIELSIASVAALPWPDLTTDGWRRLRSAGDSVRAALATDANVRISDYWRARRELDVVAVELLRPSKRLQKIILAEVFREA